MHGSQLLGQWNHCCISLGSISPCEAKIYRQAEDKVIGTESKYFSSGSLEVMVGHASPISMP